MSRSMRWLPVILVLMCGVTACEERRRGGGGGGSEGEGEPEGAEIEGAAGEGSEGEGEGEGAEGEGEGVEGEGEGVEGEGEGVEGEGEGSGCEIGATRPCGSQVGECQAGQQVCSATGWGDCLGAIGPRDEVCDLLDNDCDGQTDEEVRCDCETGAREACGLAVGVCRPGEHFCLDGAWTECIGSINPSPELCDGLDNDCDGATDEELIGPPAARTQGVCLGLQQRCDGASGWREPDYAALPGYEPQEQRCDGLDNDCDGRIDEDLSAPLANRQAGVCAGSRQRCQGAAGWMEPDYFALPGFENVEQACDGVDNDCDGRVDGPSVCCTIYFDVTVPFTTPPDATIYLAGSLAEVGGWEPAGLELQRQGPYRWTGTVRASCGQWLEYKVTRGSWETVEKDALGLEIPNRSLQVQPELHTLIEVGSWADLPLQPLGEVCESAIPVEPRLGTQVLSGDTRFSTSDNAYSLAPDHWYVFTLQRAARVRITLYTADWTSFLLLLYGDCDDSAVMAADDAQVRGYSQIADQLVAGRYWFVVTGVAEQDSGWYDLEFEVQ